MKKIISIVLSMMIMLTSGLAAAAPVKATKAPEKKLTVIKYGRFQIPVNSVEKTTGAKIVYDAKDHIVTITKGNNKIVLDLEKGTAKLNDVQKANLYTLKKNKGTVVLTNYIRLLLGYKPIDDDDDRDHDDDRDDDDRDNDENDDDSDNATNDMLVINDTATGTGLNQIQYGQGWESGIQAGAYETNNHWSNTTAATATIRFKGTAIKLYGAKAPNHGKALIVLKKGAAIVDASLVDYYSDKRKDNTLIFDSKVLPKADYELIITVAGTQNTHSSGFSVTVDRAVISGNDSATTPPPAQPDPTDPNHIYNLRINDNFTGDNVNNINKFQYTGTWEYKTELGVDNDYHLSRNTGSMANIVFQGKRIRIYGIKDINGGYVSFTLGNGTPIEVDTYSADRKLNQLLYESPLLTEGSNVLTINVVGKKNSSSLAYNVMIDRAEVAVSASSANLAYNKAATASSQDDSTRVAIKAIDGDTNTNWYSLYSDPQWIRVDLGSLQYVGRVKLFWDAAYGLAYKIQYSSDDFNWTDAYSTTTGNGGLDEIIFTPVQARYIRVYCTQRGTQYGYSLKEMEVYNY